MSEQKEISIYDPVFEKMFKDFQKQVQRSGILRELRERRYYTKPSEKIHKIKATIKRKRELQRKRRRKK